MTSFFKDNDERIKHIAGLPETTMEDVVTILCATGTMPKYRNADVNDVVPILSANGIVNEDDIYFLDDSDVLKVKSVYNYDKLWIMYSNYFSNLPLDPNGDYRTGYEVVDSSYGLNKIFGLNLPF